MGAGRYADDVAAPHGTLHAAIVRSPHAHAEIDAIDASRALALPGVHAVLTGEDIAAMSDPFLIVLKKPIDQWALAVGRVRYVGEPVAVVIADDRYIAEDGVDLVDVTYNPLPVVVDPLEAVKPDAPLLHPAAGSNELSTREFTYGDPQTAFAEAERTVSLKVEYPRSTYTPMECFVVVANYLRGDDSYDVLSNFQGPFSIHPVMARALRIPGTRLRLRIPADSGGSFGIKLSVFPYIVLMSLASRVVGRPVKWVEDRLEHLQAANSGPNRVTTIDAAVTAEGRVTALRFDNLEDYGGYLRAPMPGPLYRMHGTTTGAYDIPNLAMTNRVVVTNKMPAALVRGFGGPQLYLALERLMQRIAVELDLDPLEVIRKNLIPAKAFPYRTCAGALYDSGDYQKAIDEAVGDGRLDALLARRDKARSEGRYYGIGFATVVEPGMSNMGYLSTINPVEMRERQGPKNGAISMVNVNVDAVGTVSVTADLTVQGQGHATALSQIVADQLGLEPQDISINLELDTQKDAWSIAAGTYSCRFTPGTAVAAHIAAGRIREKVARIAAKQLNTRPEDIDFGGGRVFSRSNPDNGAPFARVAGTAHWSPVLMPETDEPGLSETGIWSPPQLEPPNSRDEINTSLTYGFVFDICGVEICPVTMEVRVDRYISMHDAGKLINPLLAKGQIHGAFVQGLASALYEEIVYDETGALQSGTFAEYLVPTACEVPPIELLHIETPSPFTPLGAKGLAEGNCMSTPVCIANAVADALSLKDVPLPVTPQRLNALVNGAEPEPPEGIAAPPVPATAHADAAITGEGSVSVAATPAEIWKALLDPESLKHIIPGCHSVSAITAEHYRAEVSLGVGPIRGRFLADVTLSDLEVERAATLSGGLSGPLGKASGNGRVTLTAQEHGTRIDYTYGVDVGGKVASVGGRMIKRAAQMVIGQFFERLAGVASGDAGSRGTDGAKRRAPGSQSCSEASNEARSIHVSASRQPRGGGRGTGRARRRCARSGGRAIADGDAEPAPGRTARACRHLAPGNPAHHPQARRCHRGRRRRDPGGTAGLARTRPGRPVHRQGAALGRPLPDAQPRHRVRLHRPCRPQLRAAAFAGAAAGGSRAALAPRRTPAQGQRVPDRNAPDRQGRRRTDHRRALPRGRRPERLRLPRGRAPARRFRHRVRRRRAHQRRGDPARHRRRRRPPDLHRGRCRPEPGRPRRPCRAACMATRRLRRHSRQRPLPPRPCAPACPQAVCGGAFMRRVNPDERVPVTIVLNGPRSHRTGDIADVADRLPAQRTGPDRNPRRLRAWRLRMLHRAHGRRCRAFMPDPGGAGARPRYRHSRGPCIQQGRARRAATRLPQAPCAPVRLLHPRHPDVVQRLPRPPAGRRR